MTHDVRYAPPQALVEDMGDHRRGPCPKRVSTAMRVLWASFALGTPSLVHSMIVAPDWLAAVFTLLTVALSILLYLKVAAGRNWARIVLTVLVTLAIVAMAVPVDPSPIMLRWLEWSSLALDAVALWLLFTGDSPSWFRRTRLVT
jgi:hypothetical protein